MFAFLINPPLKSQFPEPSLSKPGCAPYRTWDLPPYLGSGCSYKPLLWVGFYGSHTLPGCYLSVRTPSPPSSVSGLEPLCSLLCPAPQRVPSHLLCHTFWFRTRLSRKGRHWQGRERRGKEQKGQERQLLVPDADWNWPVLAAFWPN